MPALWCRRCTVVRCGDQPGSPLVLWAGLAASQEPGPDQPATKGLEILAVGDVGTQTTPFEKAGETPIGGDGLGTFCSMAALVVGCGVQGLWGALSPWCWGCRLLSTGPASQGGQAGLRTASLSLGRSTDTHRLTLTHIRYTLLLTHTPTHAPTRPHMLGLLCTPAHADTITFTPPTHTCT